MAASPTLPHPFAVPQSKLGVLTLYGHDIRITMQVGHLQIEGGIPEEKKAVKFARKSGCILLWAKPRGPGQQIEMGISHQMSYPRGSIA